MGQEVANSGTVAKGLPDLPAPAHSKPLEHSYNRELLLSFADLESCKKRPENLDPVVWRDAPATDGAEGGIAIPANSSRGLVRRDKDGEVFSKSPVDIPEWRKDSWRSGGSSSQQGPRRKPYDEEPSGSAFSTSYPPRPAANWGDSGHLRNPYERPVLQSQGSGRWEHRSGLGDREREQGRPYQKWDGEEIVPVIPSDSLRPEVPRSFGSGGPVVRPAWMPAERDGLLGSGGGLHRTYTGNFTTPSTLRVGPERQLSMGPPERQNSMGRTIIRNSESFQGSRSLKGPIFLRREDTDFVNEETFGLEGNSTDDRAEQERKRRESFELMRKDHQRLLQRQQKLLTQKHEERLANPEDNANRKHDESSLWDSTLSSEGVSSSPPKSPEKCSMESEEAISGGGVSIPVAALSTPRPAIPPGFAKVVQQMQTNTKASPASETLLEGGNRETKDNSKKTNLHSEAVAILQGNFVLDDASKVDEKLAATVSHDYMDLQSAISSSTTMPLAESLVVDSSADAQDNVSEIKSLCAGTAGDSGNEWSLRMEDIADVKKQGIPNEEIKENVFTGVDDYNKSQESLLDKWFGRPKSGEGSVEDGTLSHNAVPDESQNKPHKEDSWSEVDSRMSKFAQWFHPEEDPSSKGATLSSDILSLFPNGGINASSSISIEHAVQEAPQRDFVNISRNHGRVLPMPSGPSLQDIEEGLTANANTTSGVEQGISKGSSFLSALSLKNLDVDPKGDLSSGIFGEHSPVGKFKLQAVSPSTHGSLKSSPVFLTCEDIEQSMLAEAGTTVERNLAEAGQPSRAGGIASRKDRQAGGQAGDSAASRHLLSLLQKGRSRSKQSLQSGLSSHSESTIAPGKAVLDGYYDGEDRGLSSRADDGVVGSKTRPSDNSTLEALFGKAFMSELRSVEAPLSANAFASDFFDSTDSRQALSGVYPLSRQSSGRGSNLPANTNVSKQWPGTIGPFSRMEWTETNAQVANRHGQLTDLSVSRLKTNNRVAHSTEDSHPGSAGHGLWGNGVNARSQISDRSLAVNASAGNKGSFVSNLESTSFVLGDIADSGSKVKRPLSRVPSSELDTRIGSKAHGDGKSLPSVNFLPGQVRVMEDGTLTLGQAKVLSSDEPIIGSSTSFDSSGISLVSKEEGLSKRLVGDGSAATFASTELSGIVRDESTASQDVESFRSPPRKLEMEILENVRVEKVGLGDDFKSANDRNMSDSLSDTLGFIGKPKDGLSRASTISGVGLPEQANASLARANSGSSRFKANVAGLQPTSGFSAFQPVPPPLQHQQSIGAVYRSEPSTSMSLQPRQQTSIPMHHLQQNPGSGAVPMFPQQFHPQGGLPQQQQLLGRSFSNGGSLEFPHVAFGHAPAAPNRPLASGHLHFPPSHGHLSPPGAYHAMGHMGPAPNHFLPPGQMPQRGSGMSPMSDAHMFMQEQSLHDLQGLGSKPGPQQGPSVFPLGGHALQSGQGPMFHQPLPHNLRGQQNQLLPGPGPWVFPYSSDFMRTASKSHDLAGFANASGVAVGGGASSLDRWFGMELSRNVSGIPIPGLVQHSAHLDSESKMRFG